MKKKSQHQLDYEKEYKRLANLYPHITPDIYTSLENIQYEIKNINYKSETATVITTKSGKERTRTLH